MLALVLNTNENSITVQDVPKPKTGPKQILVCVRAVALNHVDYMNALKPLAAQAKRVLGSDFAGKVVEVGLDLIDFDDPRVKIGQRVSGFLQGVNSVNDRPGAFAEYLVVEYDLCWTIPRSLSFEEDATVSLAGMTAAQAIFGGVAICSTTETRSFAAAFYQFLGSGAVSNEVKLQPNPVRLLPGGLDKISSKGFNLLSVNQKSEPGQATEIFKRVSGEKLVFSLTAR
ncbi:ToxD-like protein [Fusarium denticulatum]|uniref:ToxD-like protein n=1 Tax=Fusarium denticulatum TaxID=48507 RepID=A0A8H5UF07_9HYPO|nr:ToxD-like protein [Fusarium denticulatum]